MKPKTIFLIVAAVVAGAAILVFTQFRPHLSKAKSAAAALEVRNAIFAARDDVDEWPSTSEGQEIVERLGLADQVKYECDSLVDSFFLIRPGPDGKLGTDDDRRGAFSIVDKERYDASRSQR